MGCCLSRTPDGAQPHIPDEDHCQAKARLPESFNTHGGKISSNRTPVLMEEETVKEVLSETPIAKPHGLQQAPRNKIREPKFKPAPSQMEGLLSKADEGALSETSQVTELCSNLSESISMATTISEQREDDEASRKRSREIGRNTKPKIRKKRPYAGDPTSRREEINNCPIKRAEAFPQKNYRVTLRYAHGTESREARTRNLNAGVEQQSGVNHVRRSRSPATRTVRGTSKMGNTKRSAMTAVKVIGRAGDQQEITMAEKRDEGKAKKALDGAIEPANESIENPLVSLECFIFL